MNGPGQREEALFEAALPLSAAERAAYLEHACGGDVPLRQRVEALLQSHEQAGHFMAEPAAPPPGPTVRLSVPLSEKAGDKIGHYKLLQQIGEGGCGVVYMAEQEEPIRRRVAFKVIKLGMDTKQVIARFEAERQALALMDHPNIARVLDAGATETGRPFFVMELVRGIKITDYCDQNNLPTEQRLDLFVQVCHAIQHAHQKGIIHRDIKPSNILVTAHDGVPVPKVIDFGIAKATEQRLTDKTLFTAFEQFIGTPAYMSPEQAEMSGLDIDTRSDIYALGVLLYELLTGRTPFDAKALVAAGLDEMRRIIREQEPARPSTRISTLDDAERTAVANRRHSEPPKLIHQVRGDLDWIVMKCLEKDRTRRYETANGLALDIERHLAQEPVTAAAPSAVYRAGKFVRRHQVGFAMATAFVLLLVAGVVVSTWEAVRATRAEKKARAEAAKSGQVARFLEDMLEGVGPSVALGRDTTMLREILDKTVERVGKDLKDQPEVEAELRNTLGGVYRVLGEYDKAEAMHRQALAIHKRLFDRDHPALALSMNDLALALIDKRTLEEAEALAREALAMRRRIFGPEHRLVAESLTNLGILLDVRGKLLEAETTHRQAVALWRKLLGDECQETAVSLNCLAQTLRNQGKLAEAETAQRQALAIQKTVLGDPHPDVATSLNNLAILLQNLGKLADAEATHREAQVMLIKLLGNTHASVAISLNSLASVLTEEGKFAEAEAMHRKALAMQRELLGNKHPDVAISLNNLAQVLRALGKPAEAEKLYREALAILKEALGSKHPNIGALINNLGRAVREQARLDEAEVLQREALAMRKEVLGDKHPAIATSLNDLGLVLRDQRKPTEAETALRQALALRRELLKNDHPDVAVSLENLALVLCDLGQQVEAEMLVRDCVALRGQRLPDDWRTFSARSLLGGILLGQKRHAEAEPLLLSSYEGLKQREQNIPAYARSVLKETLQRLVQLYEATGHQDKTTEWRQKLSKYD